MRFKSAINIAAEGMKSAAKEAMDRKVNDFKEDLENVGLDQNFIESLKQGKLLLPERMLHAAMTKALESEATLSLTDLRCTESAIELAVQAQKMGAVIAFPLTIKVQSIELLMERQQLTLSYATDQPIGKSVLGQIAVAIAAEFLKKILHGHIKKLPAVLAVTVDEQSHQIEVDLSHVPQVAKLTQKFSRFGLAPLDFVQLTGATHLPGAVQLQGRVQVEDKLRGLADFFL